MPTALSVDAFAELVQRSRLLSAEQIRKVLQELEAEGVHVDSPEALADALVRRELLTSWQVGFLLKGKHHGFFLGSYRFLKMLGKGGMGAVYLAEHQMMRRRCAIKVLPSKLIDDNSSVLERFYLEAQAVAALDDPNIVRAYDVNKEVQGKREIHYLVMEFVDGCDLQLLVQRKGPLDYVQVGDFARQAASGLAHAHECGLIHRDIKPANLLIDEKGTVKILDLGLARFFDDRLDASLTTTHNESILGTADYLSPEQALDSHNVDTRTDIYSLGCTCYYMLTGHPPFPEGSVAQRLMSHQTKSPTAIEKIRPDVPADLVTIVEKMIAKKPDNRYQTAREVVDALTAWLAQHADEDWKRKHREIVDGSASHARQEPTRARSAATEETDLELGLAPTEELGLAPTEDDDKPPEELDAPMATGGDKELGLDQLEELNPLPAFDTGSPSGGLDSLLNEALDNYPALDSNPNLAATSTHPGMASGIHVAAKAPDAAFAPNHLIKLILIGFAVSIPLCVVILFVASRFSTPDELRSRAVTSALPAPPGGEVVSQAPRSTATAPVAPIPSDAASDRQESRRTPEATNAVEPTAPLDREPTPATAEPPEKQPAKIEPATAPTTKQTPEAEKQTPEAVLSPAPEPDPAPSSEPPDPQPPRETPPTAPADARDDRSDSTESKSDTLSPERKNELLVGLSEVTVRLDRELNQKTLAYDLMVLKTGQEAVERAGLKVTDESQDTASAVLMLSFGAERVGAVIAFKLGAELKCRDRDSREVMVWKHEEEVARLSPSALGDTPPTVLRRKVSGFYVPLIKEYKQAVADSGQP